MNPTDVALNTMLDDASNQSDICSLPKSDAELKKRNWNVHWTVPELKMRRVQAHSMWTYRKTRTHYVSLANFMGRDCSLKLMPTLHFENSLAVSEATKATDKVWKLHIWLSDFRQSQWRRARVLALENKSTIESCHQMDGWPPHARLCAHPEISLESDSVQTLQKSFRWDYKPRSHTHVEDPVVHVRVQWITEVPKQPSTH